MREYNKKKLGQALDKHASMEKEAFWGELFSGLAAGGKTLADAAGETLILGPIVGVGAGGGLNYIMRPTENDRENLRRKAIIDMYRRKTIDSLDRAVEQQGIEDVPRELIAEQLKRKGWNENLLENLKSLS